MSNGFLITENPFFKHDIDKLCLICNHQFKMDQTPHSILDRLEQTQSEPQMNVYDALESISKEIKLQKKAEKVCEFCFQNISNVIRFCEVCNKSASFLKSYLQFQEMNNISQSDITHPMTYGDTPMITELTGTNVLSIKSELLNDHKEQDVQMQVWPECETISTVETVSSTTETVMLEKKEEDIADISALAKVVCTKPKIVNDVVEQNVMDLWPELVTIVKGDTSNCTAAIIHKEKAIIQQKEISNIETCIKELYTNEKVLYDEMEQDVKMEIWPELPTITTSDTFNGTAAILVKEEPIIQELSNLSEKGITNIETCLERPILTRATLINADEAIGIEKVKNRAKKNTSEGPKECKYDALECKVCGRKFPRPSKPKEHLSLHSDEKPFVYDKCGKCFSTRKRLKQHMIRHMEVNGHECKVCRETFLQPSKLKEHLVSVHSDEKPFACDMCEKWFSSKNHLKQHIIIHLEEKRLDCKVCGETFSQPSKLKEHLVSVHSDEKPFACEKCEKCFSTRKRVREHMISHLEVKRHECKVCGRTFPHLSKLTEHLVSVHSEEKPFVCEKCGKCFPIRKRLKAHMIIHLEVKGHECKVCGKKFRRSGDLRLHLSIHSEERPYKCEKCGKFFSGRHYLRQHMISHSEVKKHECHLCGNRFKHPHSLKNHLSNHCKGPS